MPWKVYTCVSQRWDKRKVYWRSSQWRWPKPGQIQHIRNGTNGEEHWNQDKCSSAWREKSTKCALKSIHTCEWKMGQKKNAFENQLNAGGQKQGKYSTSEMGQMEKSTETRTNVQVHGGKKALKPVQSNALKTEQRNALTKREVCWKWSKHGSAPKPDQTQKCIKKRTHREVPEKQDKQVSSLFCFYAQWTRMVISGQSTKWEVYWKEDKWRSTLKRGITEKCFRKQDKKVHR